MNVKELYDHIVKHMTPEQALMKLLEGQVMSYDKLKFKKGKSIHPIHLITMAAMELDWGIIIPMDDDANVEGIVVGTEKYLDSIEFKEDKDLTNFSEEEIVKKINVVYEKINNEICQTMPLNDSILRKAIKYRISKEMGKGFDVICDETNNPPEVVDENKLMVRVCRYDQYGELKYVDLMFGT
jgi:hypothetical protein